MDFFQRQDHARRNTKWLVFYFGIGVIVLIISVYLAAVLIFAGAGFGHHHYYNDAESVTANWWNPEIFAWVSVATLAVVLGGSLFKTLELSQGGIAVATMLGGRPVNASTTNPDERKLLNVVEEMSIASGIPMPQVYVLPQEKGINAFAAGHSTSDAVVAVTQGSLQLLSRDELQGVIGHEFSHILNGDMRLNVRLIGLLFGIVCLTSIGRLLFRVRTSNRRDRNPLPLLGLALMIIGGVGVLMGRLIQAAVSRQRECLADASSVQFTRNPMSLAGALKKIGGLSCGSTIEAPQAQEACHMFFCNGLGQSFLNLAATHPPLKERIRLLDPAFDGIYASVELPKPPVSYFQDRSRPFDSGYSGLSPTRERPHPKPVKSAPPPIPVLSAMAKAGTLTTDHLKYAEALRDALPTSLTEAAHDPLGACTILYALLLSAEEAAFQKQLNELNQALPPEIVQETMRLLPEVQAVAHRAKLPLIDISLPALRQMSPSQYEQFRAAIQRLIESDNEIDFFEYVLQKIVMRHLEPHFVKVRKPIVQYYSITPLIDECAILLSALACIGQTDPNDIQAAFQRGAQLLGSMAQTDLSFVPESQCQLPEIDPVLERLAQAVPQIKKNVLNACAQVIAADGVIQEMEAELLRAIADALDCPLPPFVAN